MFQICRFARRALAQHQAAALEGHDPSTLQLVFSSTKTMTTLATAVAVDLWIADVSAMTTMWCSNSALGARAKAVAMNHSTTRGFLPEKILRRIDPALGSVGAIQSYARNYATSSTFDMGTTSLLPSARTRGSAIAMAIGWGM